MSSNDLCKACTLLEGLERGMAGSVIVSPCQCDIYPYQLLIIIQTDRARKRMDAMGPAPDNLRTIPLFHSTPTVTVEAPSQP